MNRLSRVVLSTMICWTAVTIAPPTDAASLRFFESAPGAYDFGRQTSLPAGFGTSDFTLELWVLLDNSFPTGPTTSGTQQRQNWSTSNVTPYSSPSWWWGGNFLLDGHNNANFSNGTFSLQAFNGGRLRWLFGDGSPASLRTGGLHAVQNSNSASLLDGQWHQVTLVRRANGTGATLEMWIDGSLTDTENSSARPDMRTWWNNWPGFPANQSGWYWGAEKQAAIGVLSQYEDYKGNIDELRFWSRAKTASEISTGYRNAVSGAEVGLAGRFVFEGSACNQVGDTTCITPVKLQSGAWSPLSAPITPASGDTTPPTSPASLRTTSVAASSVSLAWNASTDAQGVTGYSIYRGTQLLGSSTTPTFSDNAVSASTTYSYRVAARDAAGNFSAQSAALTVVTPAAAAPPQDTTPPSIPTNLRTTSVQATSIGLTWSASTDNVAIATYRISRNGVTLNSSLTATTFADIGLQSATVYTYSISALDTSGNRSASTTLQVTTAAAATTPTCDRSTWRGRRACRQ